MFDLIFQINQDFIKLFVDADQPDWSLISKNIISLFYKSYVDVAQEPLKERQKKSNKSIIQDIQGDTSKQESQSDEQNFENNVYFDETDYSNVDQIVKKYFQDSVNFTSSEYS